MADGAFELTAETATPSQLDFVSRDGFLSFVKERPDVCLQVAKHQHECQRGKGDMFPRKDFEKMQVAIATTAYISKSPPSPPH
jgi:hypothetical protein